MKIVIALSRFPWPVNKGDRLRAFEQIKGLALRHEIHLICLTEEIISEAQTERLAPYCKTVQVFPLSRFNIGLNLIRGIFSFIPFQVHYFRSSALKNAIRKTVESEKPDVVYVQLIRMGLNIPSLQIPAFLDYMDALSAGMENRIPYVWFLKKWAMGMESLRLRWYERVISKRFSGWSTISKADANHLGPEVGKKAKVIPNGVNPLFLEEYKKTKKEIDIIFTGNMGYSPNILAAKIIINEIMHHLKVYGLNPRVCIAGANPAEELIAMSNDRVMVTGFVNDLRPYIAASRMFVAPMMSGSGLQNKLLEAMALGLPVFTTELANSSLGASPGKEVIICQGPQEFAKKISMYVNEQDTLKQIALNGKEFVILNYQWEINNQILENALLELVGQN